jgi:hypothetical protein
VASRVLSLLLPGVAAAAVETGAPTRDPREGILEGGHHGPDQEQEGLDWRQEGWGRGLEGRGQKQEDRNRTLSRTGTRKQK